MVILEAKKEQIQNLNLRILYYDNSPNLRENNRADVYFEILTGISGCLRKKKVKCEEVLRLSK